MSDENLTWLTDDFVSCLLEKEFNTKPMIIDKYHCETASKTGENYSSLLYRLIIHFRLDAQSEDRHEKSYIIKCMRSPDTDMGKMLKKLGIFDREQKMYCETLKKIQETLSSIDINVQLAPKLVHVITDPVELLVIEDLQSDGFTTGDRLTGLDLQHCEFVIRNLGLMHAASIYLNKKNPQFRNLYNDGVINPGISESMIAYLQNGVLQAVDVMKNRPKCQKYVEIFEKFSERIVRDGIELMRPIPDEKFGFAVLNHGDLWINNILFRHDESGYCVDVRFVDFQMSFFGYAGLDLNCFLFNSTNKEVQCNNRNHLLGIYHSAVVKVLKKLKYDGPLPSLADLNDELLKSKDFALMTVCINLPIYKLNNVVSEKMTTEDIMNEDSGSSARISLYDNAIYSEALEVALENLEKVGFLKI